MFGDRSAARGPRAARAPRAAPARTPAARPASAGTGSGQRQQRPDQPGAVPQQPLTAGVPAESRTPPAPMAAAARPSATGRMVRAASAAAADADAGSRAPAAATPSLTAICPLASISACTPAGPGRLAGSNPSGTPSNGSTRARLGAVTVPFRARERAHVQPIGAGEHLQHRAVHPAQQLSIVCRVPAPASNGPAAWRNSPLTRSWTALIASAARWTSAGSPNVRSNITFSVRTEPARPSRLDRSRTGCAGSPPGRHQRMRHLEQDGRVPPQQQHDLAVDLPGHALHSCWPFCWPSCGRVGHVGPRPGE